MSGEHTILGIGSGLKPTLPPLSSSESEPLHPLLPETKRRGGAEARSWRGENLRAFSAEEWYTSKWRSQIADTTRVCLLWVDIEYIETR